MTSLRQNQSKIPAALVVLLALAVILSCRVFDIELAAEPTALPAETEPGGPTVLPPTEPPDSLTIFFTDPLAGGSGGAEDALVEAVNGARQSVEIAVYNISLDSLARALVLAKERGVQVRLVMESEAMDRRVPEQLKAAGIPIVGDQREGLMHNKFTVIDGEEVWLGSMNYTAASFNDDFNNLVRVRSAQLAQNYQVNFDEMFVSRRFGPDKLPNTPYPLADAGGIAIENYFSPDDGVAREVVDELRGAEESIDFLAYSFTRDDLAEAIIARQRAGVRVRGVFDQEQYESNTGGEFDAMKEAGLEVRQDGIEGLLHDKVIIIDGEIVITGSYNFSGNAERTNDENLVIIHDPAAAAEYLEHFEKVWGTAQ